MIMSILDIIAEVQKQTGEDIRTIMNNYHVRYGAGLSYPVNEVKIDIINKSIELGYDSRKVTIGMNGSEMKW